MTYLMKLENVQKELEACDRIKNDLVSEQLIHDTKTASIMLELLNSNIDMLEHEKRKIIITSN